jgi:hypothetical protein
MRTFDLAQLRSDAHADEGIPFTLGEFTGKISSPISWSEDVVEAAEAGNMKRVMELLLGDQYQAAREAGIRPGDVQLIIGAYETEQGETVGKSSDSRPTSPPTGAPSKPISSGTTKSTSSRTSKHRD